MNILLIGNGFDLAHGLPTSYKHFLGFTKEFLDYRNPIKVYVSNESQGRKIKTKKLDKVEVYTTKHKIGKANMV